MIPRWLPHALAALLLGTLVGVLPAPATAEGETNIDHAEVAEDGTVSVLFALDGLPSGAAPDPDSVTVTLDGREVEASAEPAADSTVARTAVLALDASLSMRGGRFDAAKEAAKAYIEGAPEDIRIGLLTFSGGVHDVVEPTSDRASLVEAIDGITLTLGTDLYDAVIAAVDLAGDEGARSVLLLSDGRDQERGATIADASESATGAGVVVDAVSLSQRPADRALLTEIAEASGGRVVPSDPQELRQVFTQQADAFASQWVVTFPRPEWAGSEVDLAVAVTAGDTTYDDSALIALPAADRGLVAVESAGPGLGVPALAAGAAALALGLAVLIWFAVGGLTAGPTQAQRQIAFFAGDNAGSPPAAAPGGSTQNLRDSAVAAAQKVVEGDFETRLLLKLQGAGSRLSAAEWLLLHAGIAIAAGLVGMVLDGPLLAVLFLATGGVVPWLWLRWRGIRRRAAFHEQLAESLQLIAGGLTAGLSMPQAIDTVVTEGVDPMRSELRRALSETRLGVDLPDALDGIAQRMESQDFGWVVTAIQIQREVGGNLAELLTTVSETLRERDYVRRQVRVLTAEGRISAWVIGAMPPVMFLYLLFVRPDFVRPLYTTFPGLIMLVASVALLGAGAFVMSRMTRVEV